jgi:hypothetical protein
MGAQREQGRLEPLDWWLENDIGFQLQETTPNWKPTKLTSGDRSLSHRASRNTNEQARRAETHVSTRTRSRKSRRRKVIPAQNWTCTGRGPSRKMLNRSRPGRSALPLETVTMDFARKKDPSRIAGKGTEPQ